MSTTLSKVIGNPSRNLGLIIGSSIATTLLAVSIIKYTLYSTSNEVIPSPRAKVLKLSKKDQDELPYPPDMYPGARDVESPYGTTRVYEFGPESGRKVLLLHGISTPTPFLYPLTQFLVKNNCRVLLFDLFGRGYSDSPPDPHNSELHTIQIFLALTSSPITWTPSGFSVIGFSFGGGIAIDFTSSYPYLVQDLILLAPGGLIRPDKFGLEFKIVYSKYFPTSLLEYIVRRRLGGADLSKASQEQGSEKKSTTSAETKGNRDPSYECVEFFPGKKIGDVVQWQVDFHRGFVRSFCSCMRFGSLSGAQEKWKRLGEKGEKVMVLVGREDSVIVGRELREDVEGVLGVDKVDFREVEGGHEFVVTNIDEVGRAISGFWGL